jgi:hypothetical protein
MREQEIVSVREGPAVTGVLGMLFGAISAGVVLAVAAWSIVPALESAGGGRADAGEARASGPARTHSMIAVYVVWSEEEAMNVRISFEDWDQALRDSGIAPDDIKRFVVAQSMEDLIRGRYFDFSQVDPDDGPGSEFRYVDLRR